MWYTITLIIGIILFIAASKFLKDRLAFLKNGERTVATVIDMERSSSSDGGYTYKPIFKFSTHKKEEIIYTGYFATSPPAWEVGEEAAVVYTADNPNEIKVLTYFGTFGLPIILFAISMPFLVIGAGYFITQNFFRNF